MRRSWFLLLILVEAVGMACTASTSRMTKSEERIKSSKQMSRRNPPTVASPSLFGAWLTDTVTYHH